MKKILIRIGSIFLLLFAGFILLMLFVDFILTDGKKLTQNVRSINKIKIGMDSLTVLRIMDGPPKRRYYEDDEIHFIYQYETPYFYKFQIFIHFDSTGIVTSKNPNYVDIN